MASFVSPWKKPRECSVFSVGSTSCTPQLWATDLNWNCPGSRTRWGDWGATKFSFWHPIESVFRNSISSSILPPTNSHLAKKSSGIICFFWSQSSFSIMSLFDVLRFKSARFSFSHHMSWRECRLYQGFEGLTWCHHHFSHLCGSDNNIKHRFMASQPTPSRNRPRRYTPPPN